MACLCAWSPRIATFVSGERERRVVKKNLRVNVAQRFRLHSQRTGVFALSVQDMRLPGVMPNLTENGYWTWQWFTYERNLL